MKEKTMNTLLTYWSTKACKFILEKPISKNIHILEDGESGCAKDDIEQVFVQCFKNMINLHWSDNFLQKYLMMTSSV